MLREITPIILALLIAITLSVYSADRVTKSFEGFGALNYGAWTAWPNAGTPVADPYSDAHAARTGRIALGSAEGLIFVAKVDSQAQQLTADCAYRIEGKMPPARVWTLRIADDQLGAIGDAGQSTQSLDSSSLLMRDNGQFSIRVSRKITAGNWLQTTGLGDRAFILSLYDTSIATTTGVAEIVMPKIIRTACNDG